MPGLPSRSTCRGAQVLRGEAGASCLTDTERHFYTSEMIHSVAVLNPLYIRGSQMVFAPQGTLGSVEGQCLHAKTRGRMLLASSETTDAGSTSYRFSQRAVRPKHPHGQGYSTGSSIIYTCICVYIHIHTIMYIYYICKYTVYLIGTYVLYEICVSHIQFWSCEKLN